MRSEKETAAALKDKCMKILSAAPPLTLNKHNARIADIKAHMDKAENVQDIRIILFLEKTCLKGATYIELIQDAADQGLFVEDSSKDQELSRWRVLLREKVSAKLSSKDLAGGSPGDWWHVQVQKAVDIASKEATASASEARAAAQASAQAPSALSVAVGQANIQLSFLADADAARTASAPAAAETARAAEARAAAETARAAEARAAADSQFLAAAEARAAVEQGFLEAAAAEIARAAAEAEATAPADALAALARDTLRAIKESNLPEEEKSSSAGYIEEYLREYLQNRRPSSLKSKITRCKERIKEWDEGISQIARKDAAETLEAIDKSKLPEEEKKTHRTIIEDYLNERRSSSLKSKITRCKERIIEWNNGIPPSLKTAAANTLNALDASKLSPEEKETHRRFIEEYLNERRSSSLKSKITRCQDIILGLTPGSGEDERRTGASSSGVAQAQASAAAVEARAEAAAIPVVLGALISDGDPLGGQAQAREAAAVEARAAAARAAEARATAARAAAARATAARAEARAAAARAAEAVEARAAARPPAAQTITSSSGSSESYAYEVREITRYLNTDGLRSLMDTDEWRAENARWQKKHKKDNNLLYTNLCCVCTFCICCPCCVVPCCGKAADLCYPPAAWGDEKIAKGIYLIKPEDCVFSDIPAVLHPRTTESDPPGSFILVRQDAIFFNRARTCTPVAYAMGGKKTREALGAYMDSLSEENRRSRAAASAVTKREQERFVLLAPAANTTMTRP